MNQVTNKIKVIFICMGNICRSPSAQGVFEKVVVNSGLQDKFFIDSAGTHSYHVGGSPDSRSSQVALGRGVDIRKQKARKISKADCEKFDYIVVMDNDNHMHVKMMCPKQYHHKINKMMRFSPSSKYSEVPDPYYGGDQGFELVLDLLENASIGFLNHIKLSDD
jgi:protein-tyrosine phosphatase